MIRTAIESKPNYLLMIYSMEMIGDFLQNTNPIKSLKTRLFINMR